MLNENRWLPLLAPSLPQPVPAVVHRGQPTDHFPFHWSIVPWFDGRSAAVLPLSDAVGCHALEQAAMG